MQRQIAQLYSAAQNRPAITRFSQPVILANSAQPSTPSGGCALYAVSGQLRVIYSDGTVKEIPDPDDNPFTQGVAVPDIDVFTSPSNPPATLDGLHSAYQSLRDDAQSILRQRLIQLKNSLEGGGFIA